MPEPCRRCHGSGVEPSTHDEREQVVGELRAWLLERGVEIGPGDTVTSAVAARILNVEEQTLRADRALWGRIAFKRVGRRRVVYRLADLAARFVDLR
jgi:hypothetical protein